MILKKQFILLINFLAIATNAPSVFATSKIMDCHIKGYSMTVSFKKSMIRNLTIESAPTRPRDKASEDFTIEIINIVVIVNNRKFLPNSFLFERAFPNLTYILPKIIDSNAASNRLITKDVIGICTLLVAKNS